MSFTLSPRTLWTEAGQRGVLTTFTLESVRDHLRRLASDRAQNPTDYTRPLKDLVVRFDNKQMTAHWADKPDTRMLILDHGAQQLAQQVLPGRFFSGLRSLASIDAEGERLANEVWAKFARKHSKIVRVRTIRGKVNNEVRWIIRSCLSMDYALYSNLAFVEDVMNYAGEYARLPVLEWGVTDTGLRIRFAGLDDITAAFAPMDPTMLENLPLPMIELWNSEVGLRRVGLHGGLWRLKTATGLGHWEKETEQSWVHRGSTERIRRDIASAFERTKIIAQDVAEAYQRAIDIEIDDPEAWMRQAAKAHLTDKQMEEAVEQLRSPLIRQENTLARVVDAISLMAGRRAPVKMGTVVPKNQPEPDLYEQKDLEYVAAALMHHGIKQSNKSGGKIAA